MLNLVPGHGWTDIVAMLIVIAAAVLGFLLTLAALISYTDPDADGIPERWPN